MPSFDIISKVDVQKLDNAINTALKEIINRYDFHGSKTEVELDKKLLQLKILTENDMRMDAIRDILISRVMKQGLDPNCLDFGKEHQAAGAMLRKEVKIVNGIDKEIAKKKDDERLVELVEEGAKYRYKDINKIVRDRINKELAMIKNGNYVSYFLINAGLWDIS